LRSGFRHRESGLGPRDQCSKHPHGFRLELGLWASVQTFVQARARLCVSLWRRKKRRPGRNERAMPKQLLLRPRCSWFGSGRPPGPSIGSERLTPARTASWMPRSAFSDCRHWPRWLDRWKLVLSGH